MARVSPTPLHLAKLTVAGYALVLAAFGVSFMPFRTSVHGHELLTVLWGIRLRLLCVALPYFTGFGVLLSSVVRLSRGINRLRFTDEQIEDARRFVFQRWLTYAQLCAVLAVLVISLAALYNRRIAADTPFIILITANLFNYVRSVLQRTKMRSVDGLAAAQPIQSEHWGQAT